ncbi:MAG: hypothetical protein IT165_35290 [Bryobacterales bacterium]|nr:hypothetical protein [Bryobacterales bacterium]
MRRLHRIPLAEPTEKYLAKRQKEVNAKKQAGTLEVEKEWSSSRKTQKMKDVVQVLRKMMGLRERCVYCLDSHGADIEHFWPKAPFPEKMFRWRNLLLCCTECGRMKSDQFPLEGGRPLLIDPSVEDPWLYLDFDPVTGNLTARFDAVSNAFSPKGERTVDILQLDRREALAAGYLKTWKRLGSLIRDYLPTRSQTPQQLAKNLIEEDEHGLLGWCFDGSGQNEPPFRELREQTPETWKICAGAARCPQNEPVSVRQ